MANYQLSLQAENDIRDIAQYTLENWGKKQFEHYRQGLVKTLEAIGDGAAAKRQFSHRHPDIWVSKYRFHFIFYLYSTQDKAIIIAVIHERRDVVSLLDEFLT